MLCKDPFVIKPETFELIQELKLLCIFTLKIIQP